ncbi:uracil-DNA glycosylase [Streptomyces sp. NPDC048462]|uniref:uracil-DNA glycosylase n=1 Tax=Streptomyces sp. NPDC048462 TaxID=3365555 RepID=UPI003716867F
MRPVVVPLTCRHHTWSARRFECLHPGTPARAAGLGFSRAPDVHPAPGGLENIVRRLRSGLEPLRPSNGDLAPRTEQGLVPLNRVLPSAPRRLAAHRGKDGEEATQQASSARVTRDTSLVSVLWGSDDRNPPLALGDFPAIESSRPSPVPADRGFFGARLGRTDGLLECQDAEPVDRRQP